MQVVVSRAETCKSVLRNQSKQTSLTPQKAFVFVAFLPKKNRKYGRHGLILAKTITFRNVIT